MRDCLNYSHRLVRGFCPLKIEITQFRDRFCLKTFQIDISPSSFILVVTGLKGH